MTTQTENRSDAGPFHLDAEFDVAAFREILARAGYTTAGIRSIKAGLKSGEGVDVALVERRTADASNPFHTLARLFFLGFAVAENVVRDALVPLPIEHLFAIGLVSRDGDLLRATARIEIYQDLLVCSDFVSLTRDVPMAADHVLGVGPGAISLVALTPVSAVESVLDLGTGCGIQALLASRHAEQVVATDICPRALNFAALNARLNDIENIKLRAGSFFEPVAGERFDRIIANPPFVISPESRFVYRDGGLGGDSVSEHVARTAAAHLEENGFAVMLLSWHHATADDWAARPRSWTRGNGCDVWWIRLEDAEPLDYAVNWLRQGERCDSASAGDTLDEWVEYYERAGISRIAVGALAMRRRAGSTNWERAEHIPMDISMTMCGDQFERIFDAEELLHGLADERELLDLRFKLHPAHRVEQRMAVRNGDWTVESNKLHVTAGMDFCAQVDMPTMQFLAALDGSRTVREAAAPIAEGLGRTVEEVVPNCLDTTKRMLRIGLLMRV